MHFDFDTVIDRRNTGSVKHDTAEAHGLPADVLPLWVADMDFRAPECVSDALRKAADHGIYGYTVPTESYFQAVQDWFAGNFGWKPEKDWIQFSPGVVFALSAAIRAMTAPGDAVLVQPPVYYPFYQVIANNGRRLVESPLIYSDGRYTIDFADFEAKIRDNQVKLFILCSPHNPICRVWTREELARLGEICRKYGVQVVSDEIHCDFTWPGHRHTPFVVACPELAEDTVICTAPSKSFNLAGLQISNILIPGQQLRQAWEQELQRLSFHAPNALALAACEAAYREGGPWLEACKAYMYDNLRYVREFLAEKLPMIRLVEPEGTYFAWLDCTGLGLDKEALDELVIRDARLWLDTGSLFGQCAQLFQRVVLACPRSVLVQAMDRLYRAVNSM